MSYEMFAVFQLELLAGKRKCVLYVCWVPDVCYVPTRAASKEEKVCLMRCLLCSN